jgi:hypothetical protein
VCDSEAQAKAKHCPLPKREAAFQLLFAFFLWPNTNTVISVVLNPKTTNSLVLKQKEQWPAPTESLKQTTASQSYLQRAR